MTIQICDICKNKDKSIKSYILPFYDDTSITAGGYHQPITIEFGGKIAPKAYDLCDKCAKQLFKTNVSFLLKKEVNTKELEEEHGIISFNIKYEDEEKR